jgi:hypothetical protein
MRSFVPSVSSQQSFAVLLDGPDEQNPHRGIKCMDRVLWYLSNAAENAAIPNSKKRVNIKGGVIFLDPSKH